MILECETLGYADSQVLQLELLFRKFRIMVHTKLFNTIYDDRMT